MENDEIKQAYKNFMEFLSLEKCDRNTDFKEIYLNDKVALFLLYKDSCYFIVNEDIIKYDINLEEPKMLTYPIYKGIYTINKEIFVKLYNEITYNYDRNKQIPYRNYHDAKEASEAHQYLLECFNGEREPVKFEYSHHQYIITLNNYFWDYFFNIEKVKLNIDISYIIKISFIRKMIANFINKISNEIILKNMNQKYKMYKEDKKREKLEIFNSKNPNKQSVYVLKNNGGKE